MHAQPESFGLRGVPIGEAIADNWLHTNDGQLQVDLEERFGTHKDNNSFEYYEKLGMTCYEVNRGRDCIYLGVAEIRNDVYDANSPKTYYRKGWIRYYNYQIQVRCEAKECGIFKVKSQVREWKG